MAKNSLLVVLLALCFASTNLSGCFGNDFELFEKSRGIPGGLTLACLSSAEFTSMVIEIDYDSGYAPESSSTDLLKTRLEDVCDKPDGIEIKLTETNFDHSGQWSAGDVREQAWEQKSSDPQSGTTLFWQALFPAGEYVDDGVLGVAVDASTIVIFKDSVEDAKGPIFGRPSAEEIENSVLVHEFGHLLGLVNLVYVSPVDHEDKDHPGHSNNEESVMYWAVESGDIGNIISGQLPDEFDQDDLDDLSGILSGDIESYDQLWTP